MSHQSARRASSAASSHKRYGRLTAVLGPTNTGKTHFAIERMIAHRSGMLGLPLRLLAREVFDKIVRVKGAADCALITGEELAAMGDICPCERVGGRFVRMSPTDDERGCYESNIDYALRRFLELAPRLQRREQGALHSRSGPRFPPVVRADNEASGRYTILDIVATNALGLLYRISRVISRHGCDVDLVLIATEGEKAIDVFHITKGGSKLTEAEQQALTSDLCRTLEGTA